jgi:hypothetical protein
MGLLSKYTFTPEISFIRDLGMSTLTYPLVPGSPETVKLNSWLVELKDNSERVEFEVTEKTLCSELGVIAKLTMLLVPE